MLELILSHAISSTEIGKLGFKTILNILLIQSWFPSVSINVSLNGVAWFLSSILFCYFMFPFIAAWLKENKEKLGKLISSLSIILVTQLVITTVLVLMNIKEDTFRWATYDAPFFRLGDFLVGTIVGVLTLWHSIDIDDNSLICKQGKFFIVIIGLIGIAVNCWDSFSGHQSTISKVLGNWTTIYIPIAAAMVILFSFERDLFADIKVLMYIGDHSNYYFLIHYTVIKYLKSIMHFAGCNVDKMWFTILLVAGVLTFVLTELYMKIEGKIKKCNLLLWLYIFGIK